MVFIEAIPASELRISADGVIESGVGVEVTLQAPLVFRTHFALGELTLSTFGRQCEFLLRHLEFEDVSISTVKVQRVLASRLISCPRASRKVVVDPLEQSLKDYLRPTQKRRMGNKNRAPSSKIAAVVQSPSTAAGRIPTKTFTTHPSDRQCHHSTPPQSPPRV